MKPNLTAVLFFLLSIGPAAAQFWRVPRLSRPIRRE